jgi:putative cardiolipin synthase
VHDPILRCVRAIKMGPLLRPEGFHDDAMLHRAVRGDSSCPVRLHDLDVLGIGPVARRASGVFDRFWNSGWVMEVEALGIGVAPGGLARHRAGLSERRVSAEALSRFPIEPRDWHRSLAALPESMHSGSKSRTTDTPDHGVIRHHMPQAMRALLSCAEEEIMFTNAYVIPDEQWLRQIGEEVSKGVRLRLLTNSPASHDVPAVNSHYKHWREPLLKAGVELDELRHDAVRQSTLADTPSVAAEFVGLHLEAAMVDRDRA